MDSITASAKSTRLDMKDMLQEYNSLYTQAQTFISHGNYSKYYKRLLQLALMRGQTTDANDIYGVIKERKFDLADIITDRYGFLKRAKPLFAVNAAMRTQQAIQNSDSAIDLSSGEAIEPDMFKVPRDIIAYHGRTSDVEANSKDRNPVTLGEGLYLTTQPTANDYARWRQNKFAGQRVVEQYHLDHLHFLVLNEGKSILPENIANGWKDYLNTTVETPKIS